VANFVGAFRVWSLLRESTGRGRRERAKRETVGVFLVNGGPRTRLDFDRICESGEALGMAANTWKHDATCPGRRGRSKAPTTGAASKSTEQKQLYICTQLSDFFSKPQNCRTQPISYTQENRGTPMTRGNRSRQPLGGLTQSVPSPTSTKLPMSAETSDPLPPHQSGTIPC
jgi:hypothetical protein